MRTSLTGARNFQATDCRGKSLGGDALISRPAPSTIDLPGVDWRTKRVKTLFTTPRVLRLIYCSVVCWSAWMNPPVSAGEKLVQQPLDWPPIAREQKPWTRWWWFGSVVDAENLQLELERLARAGLGGIELTCLYGAKGYEDQYIDYLSPQWIKMLNVTSDLAAQLDLGIDLPPSSGWIYGDSWVTPDHTIVRAKLETKSLQEGQSWQVALSPRRVAAVMAYSTDGKVLQLDPSHIKDNVLDWQAPEGEWTVYLLSMAPTVQQHQAIAPGGEGLRIDPLSEGAVEDYLAGFAARAAGMQPDTVRAYYHDSFEYAIDSSPDLLDEFLRRQGYDLRHHLPALFGRADEDPSLRNDSVARVRCDYRETVAEMLHDNFVVQLTNWAHKQGSLSRNQAHGSPGNLIDLYAAADIPEAELYGRLDQPGPPVHPFTDVMSVKLASSAGHVAGRNLIAAESFTWLNNHFHTSLNDMKRATDRFLVGGANHLFFHGTAYSPEEVAWPGWLYYATTQINPRNPIWRDLPTLNHYIARCQSVLQSGQPNNDVLLYWPIYDLWQVGHDIWWQDYTIYFLRNRYELPDLPLLDANWGTVGYMQLPLHSKHLWLDPKPAGRIADRLWQRGYGFDFISDRLLGISMASGGEICSPGACYQAIVVPAARIMPLKTLQQLLTLASNGATVLFVGHLPEDVPGLHNVEPRLARLRQLRGDLQWGPSKLAGVREATVGDGRVLEGQDIESLLDATGVRREPVVDHGVQFIRRKHEAGHHYFLTHAESDSLDDWVTPAVQFSTAILLDPMTGTTGFAKTRQNAAGERQFRLQLEPGQSMIVRTFRQPLEGPKWRYLEPTGDPFEISGTWSVDFLTGGPTLPEAFTTRSLDSWTRLGGPKAERFAGTVRYSISFDAPKGGKAYLLDLGRVGDSAQVTLNGQLLATQISHPFQIRVDRLRGRGNHLEIEVTNVAANRIRDLDIRKAPWKDLHGYGILNIGSRVNKAGVKTRGLDASVWPIREAGLLGPVTLRLLD